MERRDLTFVIPTYRLRDVGETVEQYDQHFWRNGRSVPIVVFDDSSPANQEKYFPLLEQTHTHNDLFHVGPREKEQFLGYLGERLRVVVHLSPEDDGRLTGTMDSPDQGANGIVISSVTYAQPEFHLTIQTIGAAYDGTLDIEKHQIRGVWKQGHVSLPLTLSPVDK